MVDETNQIKLGLATKELSYETQLLDMESTLINFLRMIDLPAQDILVSVEERKRVFANLPAIVQVLSEATKHQSVYISKFVAAVASGLFDAALNYLWDETIVEL